MNNYKLQQLFRFLLLPVRQSREASVINAFANYLVERNIDLNDAKSWISLELEKWKQTRDPSRNFKELVTLLLYQCDKDRGEIVSSAYFVVYDKLIDDHLFSATSARLFLAHSFLILDLALNECQSAAKIGKILAQTDKRVEFSRQVICDFLEACRCKPDLQLSSLKLIVEQDKKDSLEVFADADLPTANKMVSDLAYLLGYQGDIENSLQTLFDIKNPTKHVPYLQIIHFQCCIAEYYDHAVTDLYEFAPRGKVALWLFEQYPPHLVSSGNPFLNNAKAVNQANGLWAKSKKKAERPGAEALVAILESLESMSFAARRELAKMIRLWIWRVFQLIYFSPIVMPTKLSVAQWRCFFTFASLTNSQTYGILEQRIVDAIAAFNHQKSDGWRSKGLGSSVNATNISQRKFGDCDFQHPQNATIIAYEAHGGFLSDIYIEEHLRTLEKVIALRCEELIGISDLDKWKCEIIFIAHGNKSTIVPFAKEIAGLKVMIKCVLYEEFVECAFSQNIESTYFDKYIIGNINSAKVPQKVKETFLRMLP